jgi:putative hydrolase of the HAD superfamily
MRYTDIIFDLYGTLVDIHTEENDLTWEKTAFYFGFHGALYSPDALKKAFISQMRQREANAGQSYECFPDIPFEAVTEELFRQKGVSENVGQLAFHAAQLFRITSLEYIRLYPQVKEVLSLLRSQGCRVWLLSNAQRVFTEYELRYLGLLDAFDGIYISSDHMCRKPDRRFFDALIRGQKLEREKCIMIGNDRNTDIGGAKAAGLDTLYIHTDLTPQEQAAADPKLHPLLAPNEKHTELEGWDPDIISRLPDIFQ